MGLIKGLKPLTFIYLSPVTLILITKRKLFWHLLFLIVGGAYRMDLTVTVIVSVSVTKRKNICTQSAILEDDSFIIVNTLYFSDRK
jgi:hypothetical protein